MPANDERCAEVRIQWGDAGDGLLCFRILRPGQQFVIGPDLSRTDFAAPGSEHTVTVDRAGDVVVRSPRAESRVPEGDELRCAVGALVLAVRTGTVAPPVHLPVTGSRERIAVWFASAAYVVAACLLSRVPPALALGPESGSSSRDALEVQSRLRSNDASARASLVTSPDWRPLIRAVDVASAGAPKLLYLEAPAAERSNAPRFAGKKVPSAQSDARPGGTGARAALGEGPLGNPLAPRALGTWSISRPLERSQAVARRRERPHQGSPSRAFVSVAATASGGWDHDEETSPWLHDETSQWRGRAVLEAPFGEDDPHAEDDDDVLGNTFGPEPEDPLGGGLAVAGVAPGGGGRQAGLGLGRSGPMGRGSGAGRDQGSGVSDTMLFRRDASLAVHQPRAPSMTLQVPRYVVDRVMARNAGRLRSCVRGSTPADVDLWFEIDSAGAVSRVEVRNYADLFRDLPCVESTLRQFRFLPAPPAATVVEYRVRMR